MQVLMPALEKRGSISHTVHVPLESAFLFPHSSGGGASSRDTDKGAVSSLLSYASTATSGAVDLANKGLKVMTGDDSAKIARNSAHPGESFVTFAIY